MGFFKFLQRGKHDSAKPDLNALDVPPIPPQTTKEMPSMPAFPELDDVSHDSMPEAPPQLEKPQEPVELDSKPAPPFPEPMPQPVLHHEGPPTPMPAPKPIQEPKPMHIPLKRKEPVVEEPAVNKFATKVEGPLYVRMDKFREMLKSMHVIRQDVRNASSNLSKLEEIDTNRDKAFNKYYTSISDVQKKLLFIEQTLFKKGGAQ